MPDLPIITYLLIAVTLFFSYKGFKDRLFFERYIFEVDGILIGREYDRLLGSGFLHVGWAHLLFNMLSLYVFSEILELELGSAYFLLIYFAGLIGGDLLALYIHRNHGDYSAVGASGAVCGVIFACIALFPWMRVGFFFIPGSVPGWLFGIAYVVYTIYGIKSKRDNIGHEAHLGGALVGMLTAIAIEPEALNYNSRTILAVLLPTLLFLYLLATRPHLLLIDNIFSRSSRDDYDLEHRVNAEKTKQQRELDRLLEKISRNGINSLSEKEKQKLKEYSK